MVFGLREEDWRHGTYMNTSREDASRFLVPGKLVFGIRYSGKTKSTTAVVNFRL